VQTLQMALLGTVFGFLIACPLGFLSADGVTSKWFSRPLRFCLMILRSVPALIWALFFVSSLGLGVVSGVAALSVYSIGYFAKLLYEGVEDLERKPFMALQQLGATRWQAARHALLPSSKPLLISSFIFLLEYNVRSASLLGLVGAGGLGQDLMYYIEWREYSSVFAILLLFVSVVLIFDQVSRLTREQIKKRRGL
jgi:phosphonate transport system permease protein